MAVANAKSEVTRVTVRKVRSSFRVRLWTANEVYDDEFFATLRKAEKRGKEEARQHGCKLELFLQ